MKRIGNLYEKVISFENLYKAFTKAKRGTKTLESATFFYNLEDELVNLHEELLTKVYKPVKYKYFKIYEPKEREISVAAFRDRVVHHAIINILEPIYENIFIHDSYATRKEKGTHRAIKRAQEFLGKNKWYLKADIKKYFESINPDILMQILQTKIKDRDLLWLIETIIRNSDKEKSGLPIGNLTSQFFANVYLDKFDHYIKNKLKIKYYIRYMDDFVLFFNDKDFLKKILPLIEEYLKTRLFLKLKEKAVLINQRLHGLGFLGVRIFPNIIRIKRENLKRSLNKLKLRKYQYEKSIISEYKYTQSITSILEGNISYFDTYNLRSDIIRKGILS